MKRAVPALLVALALATASVAMGGAPGPTDAADRSTTAAVDDSENGTSNASYGTAISTFMAETTANANGTVDQEMWEEAVNASGTAAALTNARAKTLQQRLGRLLEQRQELLAAHENGTLSGVPYRVRLSNLNARIDQLSAAVNATATVADEHGVSTPGLEALVSNATAVAQQVGGADATDLPGNLTDVLPDGSGPGNATDGPPNGDDSKGPTVDDAVNETTTDDVVENVTNTTDDVVENVTNTTDDVTDGGDDLPTDSVNNTTTTNGGDVL